MMEYIKGILIDASPVKVTIETSGIGYRVYIPISHYPLLPKTGELLLLFLSTIIREDAHKNYGFLTVAERDLFEDLIVISGIGPKTALALLGHLIPDDLQLAISKSDVNRICKVPGIGKKTAERLIVEMRDRLIKKPLSLTPLTSSFSSDKSCAQDALSALVNLGYPAIQAQKAIQIILKEKGEDIDLSNLITLSLKQL